MPKVTFDGLNKRITVNVGVTALDVERDLYSEWKMQVQSGSLTKFEPAFRTFGGDSTVGSQTAPKYFFLTNGWRVVVDGQDVIIASNLYTDEGDSPTITLNGGTVSISNSDVPVVKNEIADRLDYAGYVVVDPNSAYAGDKHPTGTQAQPVNNIVDGLLIAQRYSINKFHIRGHVTLNDNFQGYTFKGEDYSSRITVSNTANVNSSVFEEITVDGDFAGADVRTKRCTIKDALNLQGEFTNCGIAGDILVSPYGILTLDHCTSRIPGDTNPTIDMNPANDVQLNIRAFSGGIDVVNCDTSDSIASIEFTAGKINIDSTCTAGILSIRGVVLVNDASAGTTVDTSAVVSAFTGLKQDERDHLLALENPDLSEITSNISELLDATTGNWEISGNQMIFYKRDSTELMRFEIRDEFDVPNSARPMKRVRQ